MENKSKMDTPKSEKEIWSPNVFYGNHPDCNGAGLTSTPYWPVSFKKLDDSAGSSKQDSGYCSATPRSADSVGLFDKCRLCNKSLHHSYDQSTPDYMCSCKKPQIDGSSSPNLEYLEAIKEVKMSPTPKLPSRARLNRPLELGLFEDAMDTSLYQEEMEVDHHSSAENHQCSLEFLELSEEKSVDFMEPEVLTATEGASKEGQSICLPSSLPTNRVKLEDCNSQGSDEKECKMFDSEDLFDSELFNCNLISPKIKNESTPTKLKRRTPPLKMKKGNSSFQSSAKKVATMNRVIRSFFPLNGIESVDFLYQLGVKRNFRNIVEKIFSFLTGEDLDAVRVVSKTWNKLLYNDFAAFNRWQHFRTTGMMKENLTSPVKQGGSRGRDRPALIRLQNVVNPTSPPRQSISPPVSPSSARFHYYQRAIKSLKKDERVLPCPKCRFPSTDRGNPVAQCPRSGCRHRFCVWCSNEVLPDLHHNCPPLITPRCLTRRNATVHSVGSKSSKRNLRRL